MCDTTDRIAQRLWEGVSTASEAIADLITDIPSTSVRGNETRCELHQAQTLLGQAAALLERTRDREAGRYTEVANG